MDLVTVADKMPAQGETISGEHFETLPGGKGANQAVAAARLGADVSFIGKVGNDAFGELLLKNFEEQNVSIKCINKEPDISSGLANITVSDRDNRIIIIAGANGRTDTGYVDGFREEIKSSDYVLIQFEIPKKTIEHIIDICYALDVPFIINPAPAMHLDDKYWEKATYITPNENEAEKLFSSNQKTLPEFHEKLIITNGSKGASYFEEDKMITVPSEKAKVIDTTGAGDTFNGALAVALSGGRGIEEAIAYANKAAALSVQKLGAQRGMPDANEMK